MVRLLVSYAHYEGGNERYHKNLEFFIKMGYLPFRKCKNIETVLHVVVQGHTCSADELLDSEPEIVVHRKENKGYDLGAHGYTLKFLQDRHELEDFDYFLFLNCGQRGPFLPSYWDRTIHWFDAFLVRMNQHENPGICGSSIFCHRSIQKPVVETWAFAMPQKSVLDVLKNTKVFHNHKSKEDVVVNGEDALGPYLYDRGYQLESLLYKYKSQTWDQKCQPCQKTSISIPSHPFQYDGIMINPLEVIFYKTYYQSIPGKPSYDDPTEAIYTVWSQETPNYRARVSYGKDNVARLHLADGQEQTLSSSIPRKVMYPPRTINGSQTDPPNYLAIILGSLFAITLLILSIVLIQMYRKP